MQSKFAWEETAWQRNQSLPYCSSISLWTWTYTEWLSAPNTDSTSCFAHVVPSDVKQEQRIYRTNILLYIHKWFYTLQVHPCLMSPQSKEYLFYHILYKCLNTSSLDWCWNYDKHDKKLIYVDYTHHFSGAMQSIFKDCLTFSSSDPIFPCPFATQYISFRYKSNPKQHKADESHVWFVVVFMFAFFEKNTC